MTKKDIIKLVAKEYVRQYREDVDIYNALKPLGIYVEKEGNLEEAYLEQIFNGIAPDLCSALGDFAEDGKIDLKPNRMAEWETVTDIDRIIDIYFEDIED